MAGPARERRDDKWLKTSKCSRTVVIDGAYFGLPSTGTFIELKQAIHWHAGAGHN
jgi:hypothetical protein